jgi:hypothetical protein
MTEFNDYNAMAYADLSNRPARGVGEDHLLTESYATSQLPLVAPNHPEVVAKDPSKGYDHLGTYTLPRYSIAVFIPAAMLFDNHVVRVLLEDLHASHVGKKIEWESFEARREKLHATVCGGLENRVDEESLENFVRDSIAGIPAFSARLFGPWFFSPKNGRIYLPMVAERQSERPSTVR